MIHVQCTYLNPNTMTAMNSLEQTFIDHVEFMKFYKLAKTDPYVIVNIVLKYDPKLKPGLKNVNDAQLLRLGKDNPL